MCDVYLGFISLYKLYLTIEHSSLLRFLTLCPAVRVFYSALLVTALPLWDIPWLSYPYICISLSVCEVFRSSGCKVFELTSPLI